MHAYERAASVAMNMLLNLGFHRTKVGAILVCHRRPCGHSQSSKHSTLLIVLIADTLKSHPSVPVRITPHAQQASEQGFVAALRRGKSVGHAWAQSGEAVLLPPLSRPDTHARMHAHTRCESFSSPSLARVANYRCSRILVVTGGECGNTRDSSIRGVAPPFGNMEHKARRVAIEFHVTRTNFACALISLLNLYNEFNAWIHTVTHTATSRQWSQLRATVHQAFAWNSPIVL